jgi:hypothetical protein
VHRARGKAPSQLHAPGPANGSINGAATSGLYVDPAVLDMVREAGGDISLDGELGALRLVLSKLLQDDGLPVAELAKHVARIAATAAVVAKAKRAISGELAEGITDALTQILVDLGNGGGGES